MSVARHAGSGKYWMVIATLIVLGACAVNKAWNRFGRKGGAAPPGLATSKHTVAVPCFTDCRTYVGRLSLCDVLLRNFSAMCRRKTLHTRNLSEFGCANT